MQVQAKTKKHRDDIIAQSILKVNKKDSLRRQQTGNEEEQEALIVNSITSFTVQRQFFYFS